MDKTEKGYTVGIDLGTTNSLVAKINESGQPEVLPTREMEYFLPSAVGLLPGYRYDPAHVLVGRQAANNARRNPKDTIRSIKRLMGLQLTDPKVDIVREHVKYEIVGDPARGGCLAVRLGGALLTPEEVSALILARLKEDAERVLGGPVIYAVVTVPAYFTEPQRVATERAAALAGLCLKSLLDEPTAAALAECEGDPAGAPRRLVVFDFGGGTLDVTYIHREDSSYHVLGYAGDNFLGGDDIDRAIASRIEEWIRSRGGIVTSDDAALQFLLKESAEQAKRSLSAGVPSVPVVIPHACRDSAGNTIDVDMDISQQDFARLLEPILRRIRVTMEKFIREQSIRPEYIDRVVMVGGSSAVPAVQALLKELFEPDGKPRVRLSRSPMEAVAKGAAIFAAAVRGLRCRKGHENPIDAQECGVCGQPLQLATTITDPNKPELFLTLPRSLGIRYREGENIDCYQVILPRGTLYPTAEPATQTFKLPAIDKFRLEVYEGEEPQATRNTLVTVIVVDQVPSDVKVGDPLAIHFSYDRNRKLLVSVSYPGSKDKRKPSWVVRPAQGPETVGRDDPIRSLVETLRHARAFMDEYQKFLTAGMRRSLSDMVSEAHTAVTTGDHEEAARLNQAILQMMFNGCGNASILFIAEHTVIGSDPEFGPEIKDTAQRLRVAIEGKTGEHEQLANALQTLLMSVVRKKRPTADVDVLPVEIIPYR